MPSTPASQPPKRVWTAFLMMFASVIMIFTFQSLLGIGFILKQNGGTFPSPDKLDEFEALMLTDADLLLASAITTQFVIGGIVIGAVQRSKESWRERLDFKKVSYPLHIWICLMLITLSCGAFAELILPRAETIQSMETAIQSQNFGYQLSFLFAGSFLPAFFEEILCRGYIETRLLARWNAPAAIFTTSLFFGALHMNLYHSLFAFFLGLWLGWLHLKSKSIVPGIVCHFMNNFLSFLIMIILTHTTLSTTMDKAINLFFVLGGAISFVVFLRYQKNVKR